MVEIPPTSPARGRPRADDGSRTSQHLPAKLGDYELLDEIARGGMGVVFRARQRQLNRTVAVKLLRDARFASSVDRQRFLVEAEAAAALSHPDIVTVYEIGEHEGTLFFSMELIDGTSLAHVLDVRGRFPPHEAAALVARLARAVHHAHERGVLHRDIKPGNVLMGRDGRIALTDFGIAKRLAAGHELTTAGSVLGTPGYIAPEAVLGRVDSVGPASDVYGLGAVLYRLLVGEAPFAGDTPAELLIRALDEPPRPPRALVRDVPSELEAVCLHCLEKEPGDRYASALALAEDLERFLSGEPVLARPRSLSGMLREQLSRQPMATVTWLAIAVLMLVEWVMLAAGQVANDAFHWAATLIAAGWAGLALALQTWSDRTARPRLIRGVWALVDVAFLTAVLLLGRGPSSAIIVVYPVLVFATAFRFRRGHVWFVAALCAASYVVVVVDAAWRRPEFSVRPAASAVTLAMLLLSALVASEVVRRMRALAGLTGRASRGRS